MNYAVFRFDVDTVRCVRSGVPALRALAESLDVQFTFFVNMGRAVSYTAMLSNRSREAVPGSVKKLGNLYKLGIWDFLLTALRNPRVGCNGGDELRKLEQARHEIGLHGGYNHGAWMRHARGWSDSVLSEQIEFGLYSLRRLGIFPTGFSSPGWCSPATLGGVLAKYGFRYFADLHAVEMCEADIREDGGLVNIPTNILGEPGGVGYFESLVAEGKTQQEMLADYQQRLAECGRLAVMYDHPGFVFPGHIETLGRMVELAQSDGRQIVTLQQYLDRTGQGPEPDDQT